MLRRICRLALLISPFTVVAAHGGETSPDRVQFNRDIRPILSDKCFACHGPDSAQRKAGLRLDQREAATGKLRSGGSAVVPGKPDESALVTRVFSADDGERMPPVRSNKPLTAREKDLLKRWVAQGAEYQLHWSFLAPTKVALPKVKDGSWPRNPIDAFILTRLEREGMKPAAAADKIPLLRRATLDLTGLPPTPTEVDAFLADNSPDAYDRAVDRLLASPRYGQRMAIDWLDAARYADSNGYQVDRDREMWPWRDWVVNAFNRNLSFDQFTIEQLAGDLIPNATREQRVATGLHRNHMLNEEGGIIPEEFLAEYVADRVETTATIWLGLTLGCARCHDHKFDALSQKDFYGMFAIFHNVPESGLGNYGAPYNLSAPPLLKLPTPDQQRLIDNLTAAIKEAEAKLAIAGQEIPTEVTAWEKSLQVLAPPNWTILNPTEVRSQGGAVLTRQSDGSILATGPNPNADTYTFVATAGMASMTGLRLEALPDKSLPARGPGRVSNGNFVLTDVRLTVAGKPVKFKATSADFSQKDYPIANVIDGNLQSGWAIHPEVGKPHEAILELDSPLLTAPDTPLSIALDFQSGIGQHQIGKFRLAATNAVSLHDKKSLPPTMAKVLAVPAGKRNPSQKAEVLNYYCENVSPIARWRKERTALEAGAPTVMVMAELPKPRDTYRLIRGQYDKKGEKIGPATPASLPQPPTSWPANRLGLAKWLVDPANPLTARVAVNRYWQTFFGAGLVRTAEDFGSQGEAPSHPELLDWLALEFMRSGWNVKQMHKLILTSATYCQSSRFTPQQLERDPENRLLSRAPRFRLPAESIRDQALAASGLLDEKWGGPPVKPYHPPGLYEQIVYGAVYQQGTGSDLYRRSLYTYWKRSLPHPAMLALDAPFRETCAVRRPRTSTPLQALNLMNDPTYVEAARFLGQRMMAEGGSTPEQRIAHGFRLAVARAPRPTELSILTRGFNRALADFRADRNAAETLLRVGERPSPATLDRTELAAYATIANTLLNLDETITKE